ncbi:hypothetical protein ACFPFX_30870 [Streptomyces mauvecolor]|uniref:UvrD-like helicase C-terminal domain-containing protein n=1 Tax=Streptomyces mauvecolor TaxID=58345 RepID=A0ABV9UXZ9_9ACTN
MNRWPARCRRICTTPAAPTATAGFVQALHVSTGRPAGLLIVTVQARADRAMDIGPSKP